jgi:hypothetical protein
MDPGKRSRVLGWWYLSIGAGFLLLGLNRLLMHDRAWLVLLRWLVAAGFFLLGGLELTRPGSRP